MKRCSGPCGRERKADSFFTDRARPDGLDRICKFCKRKRELHAKRLKRGIAAGVICTIYSCGQRATEPDAYGYASMCKAHADHYRLSEPRDAQARSRKALELLAAEE